MISLLCLHVHCICQWKWIEIEKSLLVPIWSLPMSLYSHILNFTKSTKIDVQGILMKPQYALGTSIFCCDLLLTYPGDSSWSRKDYHWHIYSSHWEPRNHSTKQFILIVWNLNCTIALKAAIFHSWCVNMVYFYRDGKI